MGDWRCFANHPPTLQATCKKFTAWCSRFASVLWTLTWEFLTPPLFLDPARQHRYDINTPVSYLRMAARRSLFDNLDGGGLETLPSQNGNANRDFERLSPYCGIFYV